MTFLLGEDAALRERLMGMLVSDDVNATRPVGVWFGQPDAEIAEQKYPYVTIELIDVAEAPERVHAGKMEWQQYMGYMLPPLVPAGPMEHDEIMWPTPVNLDYQVTTYSRHPRHDRDLIRQILYRLPMRGGSIDVVEDETAQYATARRLDFLGLAKSDGAESGKRLFRNVVTVRISSELLPSKLERWLEARAVSLSIYGTALTGETSSATLTFRGTAITPVDSGGTTDDTTSAP